VDVFSERVWDWVQMLVVGAIVTPGHRPPSARQDGANYQDQHVVERRRGERDRERRQQRQWRWTARSGIDMESPFTESTRHTPRQCTCPTRPHSEKGQSRAFDSTLALLG